MKFLIIILFTTVLHGYCKAAKEFSKCSVFDSECQQVFLQGVGMTYAPTGIPAIGVPPLDPYHLENVTVPVMDMLTLKLINGDCLGIGTCTVINYETDMVNFRKIAEIICDRIVIQGSYEILPNPFINLILGKEHGSGNVSIVLEDWYFKFNYSIYFEKHEDGEIYMQIDHEDVQWVSNVLKNATVAADNIMMYDLDVTETVLDFINKYWRMIFDARTFGKAFHKISVEEYIEMYDKFYNFIPTSSYLSEDLTPYLKKDQQ